MWFAFMKRSSTEIIISIYGKVKDEIKCYSMLMENADGGDLV